MEKVDKLRLVLAFVFGITAISTIGILAITLHFFPALFDVFEVLAILIAVIIVSKVASQLYYTKIKKEIGF